MILHRKDDKLPEIGKTAGLDVWYAPTFAFSEDAAPSLQFIRDLPREDGLIKPGIAGWLCIQDAEKLYEMALCSEGDILELGTYQGLSTWMLAMGVRDSGIAGRKIVTVDLFEAPSKRARQNLESRQCADFVEFVVADATDAADRLLAAGTRFGFAFVDHSHEYHDMMAVNRRYLPKLLLPGSFALFHDFTSPRNTRNVGAGHSHEEYGVAAACHDAFADGSFEYWGAFGACGLFRRRG